VGCDPKLYTIAAPGLNLPKDDWVNEHPEGFLGNTRMKDRLCCGCYGQELVGPWQLVIPTGKSENAEVGDETGVQRRDY
jgi:hypothetical protein